MKKKQFEKMATDLWWSGPDIEHVRLALVRAYKKGVKDGIAQKERHVSHED